MSTMPVESGPKDAELEGRSLRVPWGLRDMLLAVLAAIGLIALGTLALAILVVVMKVSPGSLPARSLFLIFALEALLVVPVWLWGPRRYGGGWASLGLRRFSVLKGLGLCIVALPVILVMNGLWELARRALGWAGQPDYLPLFGPGLAGLGTALLLGGVVAPVAEEVFFRGFLYAGLRGRLGLAWGLIASAAIFSLAHILPGVLLPIFAMGLLFCLLYEFTGSIWPCIALHSAINSLAFVVAYLAEHYPSLFGS